MHDDRSDMRRVFNSEAGQPLREALFQQRSWSFRPAGALTFCVAMMAFVACSGEPSPAVTPIASDETSAPASDAAAIDDAMPVAAPAATPAPPSAGDEASFMGYGAARFGMTAAQVRQALLGSLREQNDPATACYFLQPKEGRGPPYFTLMIEDGKFVRYDVGNDTLIAPGGGKRGTTSAQLDALYRNALQDTPHKFVKGGLYRSISASGVAPSTLVFETNAAGNVTEWHVGLSPQAAYVEGCEKHT